jgi:septum formation inhibitor MinC
VARSAAEAEIEAEQIQDTLDVQVSSAERNFSNTTEALDAELESLEAKTNSALGEIERKRQQYAGVFNVLSKIPVVSQAAASAGLDLGGIGTLVLGGGGLLAWQAKRGRQREDLAWKEAKEEADKQREREHAAWEEAQTAMLRMNFQGTPRP